MKNTREEEEKNYDDVLRNIDSNNMDEDTKKGIEELEQLERKSLGRVERVDYTEGVVQDIKREHGYFDLDPSNFPSGGIFYRKDIKIRIKSATVKEIRDFSSLDEDSPYEVDEAIINLLTGCTRVSFSDKVGSWKDILEEDRLYLILSIRQLTFAENENMISFTVKCESCGTDNKMEIKNENFQKREISEKLTNYYDEEKLGFSVTTKSYGTIFIKPPTGGIMRHVSSYIKDLRDRKENLKEYIPFLKILPYLLYEWRNVSKKDIDNLKISFAGWDRNKFMVYSQLCELAQVSVKDKMMMHCTKCTDPIEAEIQLPTGIKGLFIESNILGSELI